MSLQYCANLVHEGDPHRFNSAMAAPLALRHILLPIYALNVEIIRAPRASTEPMIAEMRLQWWHDVLDELKEGQGRSHPVIDAVKGVITPSGIAAMQAAVAARRADIGAYEFLNKADMLDYVGATTFGPLWAAYTALQGRDEYLLNIRNIAQVIGLARFYRSVPDVVKGHDPSAAEALGQLRAQRFLFRTNSPARAALIEAAGTMPVLKHMQKGGALPVPEFALRTAGARARLAFGISCGDFSRSKDI